MKCLRLLWLHACAAYYNRACAHDPSHPDLPYVLRKRTEVADAIRDTFSH